MRPWCYLHRGCHPSREVCLKGLLINVAIGPLFASDFDHNLVLEKYCNGSVQKTLCPCSPFGLRVSFGLE